MTTLGVYKSVEELAELAEWLRRQAHRRMDYGQATRLLDAAQVVEGVTLHLKAQDALPEDTVAEPVQLPATAPNAPPPVCPGGEGVEDALRAHLIRDLASALAVRDGRTWEHMSGSWRQVYRSIVVRDFWPLVEAYGREQRALGAEEALEEQARTAAELWAQANDVDPGLEAVPDQSTNERTRRKQAATKAHYCAYGMRHALMELGYEGPPRSRADELERGRS